MRTFLSLTMLCALSLLWSQCSQLEYEELHIGEINQEELNFPQRSEEFGKAVAKELRTTVTNLHKMGVDYSNANTSLAFRKQFDKDFYKASPIMTKSGMSVNQLQIEPELFREQLMSLTKIQVEYIIKIQEECSKSTSFTDLSKRLKSINDDIYKNVPEIEQERLFNITSTFYYGIKEIEQLEAKGLMPKTPQSNIKNLRIKTRSESSFGDACRKFLATGWVIAVGEPTPAGEIVMSVVTLGYVSGVLLYEVITCAAKAYEKSCMKKYLNCDRRYYHCQDCWAICLGNRGIWPYDKCSI